MGFGNSAMDKVIFGICFCLYIIFPMSKGTNGVFTAVPRRAFQTTNNVPNADSDCGSHDSPITFILEPGHKLNISSPKNPGDVIYKCHWLVRTAPGYRLQYRFIGQFQLESYCSLGNVKLYDYWKRINIIGTYCGSYRPIPGATTSSYLYVRYESYKSQHAGFNLEVTSKEYDCGTSNSPTTYVLDPQTKFQPRAYWTHETIIISSPNFPDHYPKNETCHWLFLTAPDSRITYRFIHQFQLVSYEYERCPYDNVKIYDSSNTSNIIGSYCGLSFYDPGTSTGRYLYVSFTSDGNAIGFKLEISAAQYARGSKDSPITYVLGSGQTLNITSPNYPDNYPDNSQLYWLVQTAPDSKLKYRFIGEFRLEFACFYDNVTLYDSSNMTNVIGTYCSSSPPNPGTTTGRYLYVSFVTDGSYTYAGFNLEVTS